MGVDGEMDILDRCINEGLAMGHLSQAVHVQGGLLEIHHGGFNVSLVHSFWANTNEDI